MFYVLVAATLLVKLLKLCAEPLSPGELYLAADVLPCAIPVVEVFCVLVSN